MILNRKFRRAEVLISLQGDWEMVKLRSITSKQSVVTLRCKTLGIARKVSPDSIRVQLYLCNLTVKPEMAEYF